MNDNTWTSVAGLGADEIADMLIAVRIVRAAALAAVAEYAAWLAVADVAD